MLQFAAFSAARTWLIVSRRRLVCDKLNNMTGNAILIVGVGNSLRRDDGAGLLLAALLHAALEARGCAAELRLVPQLLPEMAEEIGELAPRALVLADCAAVDCAAGEQAGRFQPLVSSPGPQSEEPLLASHSLTPAKLLALAQRLYGFGGPAWLATVPGADFAHGEGVSAAAESAIAGLVPLAISHLQ
jgi:hydrogenase maturation protease